MAELRLVGVSDDGQHLVLADGSGDEHAIVIDERLRAAVNGHLSRLGQLTMALESRISPREIQDRVRGGEAPEHVAVTAGVPLERVLRFVGPVLREREHVADQARRARLAGSNGPASLLADIVARAAARQGVDADDIVWDSARREDHSWTVTVTWPDGPTATWALDLARHQATPADPAARRISGLADDTPVVLPAAIDLDARLRIDERLLEGSDDNVRAFVPRAVPAAPAAAPDAEQADDAGARASADQPSADQPSADQPGGAGDAPDLTETAPISRRPSRGSRRARVPKWDDIMFGPKSKD